MEEKQLFVVVAASHTDRKTNHAELTLRQAQSFFVLKSDILPKMPHTS